MGSVYQQNKICRRKSLCERELYSPPGTFGMQGTIQLPIKIWADLATKGPGLALTGDQSRDQNFRRAATLSHSPVH